MRTANKYLVTRLSKEWHEPNRLTWRERIADELLSLENTFRYIQQSANTRDGQPGQLPPRQTLTNALRD